MNPSPYLFFQFSGLASHRWMCPSTTKYFSPSFSYKVSPFPFRPTPDLLPRPASPLSRYRNPGLKYIRSRSSSKAQAAPCGLLDAYLAGRTDAEALAFRRESGTALRYTLRPEQADVAQLVEQLTRNEQVSGSSPLVGSLFCP